jgi:hypothetical protein
MHYRIRLKRRAEQQIKIILDKLHTVRTVCTESKDIPKEYLEILGIKSTSCFCRVILIPN